MCRFVRVNISIKHPKTFAQMKKQFVFFCLFILALQVHAQDSLIVKTDSIVVSEVLSPQPIDTNAVALPEPERTDTSEQALLPTHYLFTQRWLWGANGLMRNFDTFALSLEAREREIEIREKMNQVHRIAGYVSLAGMIGSGITGQMSSKGNEKAKDLHETFTGVTNFTYFGSLAFALFSPPPMRNRTTGFTKLNIHRTLAIVHVTSMLATNILSGMLENNSSLVPYHRIAAITAFSSLFVATVVIKL